MEVVALVLAGLFSIILGIVVVIGQPRRALSWFFLAAVVSSAVWSWGIALFSWVHSLDQLSIIIPLYYIAAAFIAPSALLMIAGLIRRIKRRYVLVLFLPTVALTATIIIAPHTLIRDIVVGQPNTVQLNALFYLVYIVYFVLYFYMAIYYTVYVEKHKKLYGVKHTQVRSITAAYGIAGVVGMAFNLVLPAFGNYLFVWIGPLCLFIFVPMVYYAIAKHRLFDLRLALVNTIAYAFSLGVLSLIYFGLAYLVSLLFFRSAPSAQLSVGPLNVALALVLAFIFQPIRQFFDRWTNKIFYRDRYEVQDFIESLGRIVTSTTQLQKLLDRSLEEITTTLKIRDGGFVVYRDHHEDVWTGTYDRTSFSNADYELLRDFTRLQGTSMTLLSDESKKTDRRSVLRRFLYRKKITLVMPLMNANETIGYLLLGEQLGTGYTKRDMRTLETIKNELVIGIANARSIQAVRDANTHLEQRVNDATRELQKTNRQLIELDETKDEFVSMASHQLRTPLTSVKGYISMVIEGDAGKITSEQKKLLNEAFVSSERMVHLISDFLNVNRLQTGKFVIDRVATDLSKTVSEEVASMKQIASSHGVAIVYKAPARFPMLYIDDDKIRQAIVNFMDNAVYYSPESKKVTVSLSIEDGDAVLRVIDQGIGVPPAEQHRLFTKFFRAQNARKQRPDGTGVGLFLAKKVVDGHGGSLVFHSIPGKGSTFGFRLPIKQLKVPPKDDEVSL